MTNMLGSKPRESVFSDKEFRYYKCTPKAFVYMPSANINLQNYGDYMRRG